MLADWAAIAIANSRLYRDVRQRHDELQRANRGLETTTEIGRALGGVTDLDRVLELVVKRSRALIDARATELALLDGDELVIAAAAGQGVEGVEGTRVPIEGSAADAALRSGRAQRVRDVPQGATSARTALVVPMTFRNKTIGFLSAFDRAGAEAAFTDEDERLLQAFAASAATAVATAQSASDEALRRSIRASEEERSRWARELHDETLQDLAGLKVLLSGARRQRRPRAARRCGRPGARHAHARASPDLRALITDLRPAALDSLGTEPALRALASRVEKQSGLSIELDIRIAYEQGGTQRRHSPDVEAAVYRLVQEALNNVAKHAEASTVWIEVLERIRRVRRVEVRDDGRGFDPDAATGGFGLVGMRERVGLVQGKVEVTSAPGEGTTVRARIPVERSSEEAGAPSEARAGLS